VWGCHAVPIAIGIDPLTVCFFFIPFFCLETKETKVQENINASRLSLFYKNLRMTYQFGKELLHLLIFLIKKRSPQVGFKCFLAYALLRKNV
jgi:hypothetical protein